MSILRTIHKATQDLRNRVMLMLSRGVLYRLDDDEGLQIAQVGLLANEIRDNIERFQDYGFTSVPQEGADVVAGFFGGNRDHGVLLRVDDRRCRLAGLKNGEVAIYTDEGDTVILKRNNTIEVTTKRLIIKAEDEVDVETKKFNVETQKFAVNASESITMSAPRTSQNTDSLTMAGLEQDGPCEATFKADMRLLGDMLQQGDYQQMGSHLLSGSLDAGGRIVGNPVLGAVEGGGGSAAAEAKQQLENDIQSLAKLLNRKAQGDLITCLPDIAAAEAARSNERDRRGWEILEENMQKWLSRRSDSHPNCIIAEGEQGKFDNGGQEPTWVEWEWLMQYERFAEKVEEMKDPEYLFGPLGKTRLAEILADEKAFEGGGQLFKHIPKDRSNWDIWRKRAFQSNALTLDALNPLNIPKFTIMQNGKMLPDGFQVAIANTTVYGLADGETRIRPGGFREVEVNRVAFFIHDGFDFSGKDQLLGNWECNGKIKQFTVHPLNGSLLRNSDFNSFREDTGYGCDFRTMCAPELVWEGRFWYNI